MVEKKQNIRYKLARLASLWKQYGSTVKRALSRHAGRERMILHSLFITSSLMLLGPMSYGQWIQKNIRATTGDKSIETYIIYTDSHGIFSNSTTINSEAIVQVLIKYSHSDSLPDIRFYLYEYGREPAVGKAIDDAQYELTIILSDNTAVTYYLSADEHSLDIRFDRKGDRISFINRLKEESKPIKCSIIVFGEHRNESYNFKINSIGLSDALSRIKKK